MADLDSLQIRISASATQAEKSIDRLTYSLRRLGDAMNVGSLGNFNANLKVTATTLPKVAKGFNLLGNGASKAQKSTKSLAATMGKFFATYWIFMRIGKAFGSFMNYASDLVEVQNVVDNTFGDMKDKMEDFAKSSVDTLGMSELTSKQIATRFQAMGVNMGVPQKAIQSTNDFLQAATKMGDGSGKAYADVANSVADISLNLTKLAGDMASFYNQDYKEVAQALESIYTGQTRPLRRYGLDLTQATLKEFALKNGMDANIKTMSQYEKMLLRYEYVMANTTAAHGDFQRTINTWANQMKIAQERLIKLKSVLGTIGVNVFKPLVKHFNDAMNTIIHLAESTLNSLGKIFGWKVEISDVGVLEDEGEGFADSMDDAAGSAKKLKDYMLGIDELNVFDPNDGKGGGGGGASASGLDTTKPSAKWEETEKGYDSIYDTLFKLGKRIGEVEKEFLQGIKWDDIYKKAEAFGKGLASFLNGYLSDAELFYEKGRLIANTLNTIGHALKAFGEEFNGYQLGVDIGSFINGITYNIDWATLNKAAYEIAHDIAETINGMVKTTDWTMVGKTIAEGLNLAIRFAATLLTETDFTAIGKALGEGINGFIKNFDSKTLAKAIKAFIQGALDFTSSLLSTTDFDELGKKIGQFLKDLKLSDYIDDIARLIGNIIAAALKLAGSMILEAPFESALLIALGAWKLKSSGIVIGGKLATSIASGLETTLLPKLTYIMTANLGQVWSNATLGRKAAMIGMGIGGSIIAGVVGYKLGNGLSMLIADLTDDPELAYYTEHVGEEWGNVWADGFVEGASRVGAGLKEMFSSSVDWGDVVSGEVGDQFYSVLGVNLSEEMQGVYRTWNDVLNDIRSGVISLSNEEFQALKDYMIETGGNTVDVIQLVNQLQSAQQEYAYTLTNVAGTQVEANDNVVASFSRVVESHDLLRLSAEGLVNSSGNVVLSMSELQKVQDYNTMSADEAYKAYQREFGALTDLDTTMNAATRTVSSFSTGMNGMPSGIMQVSDALDSTVDSTEVAKAQTEEFQNLWTNYTISNIDISQLEEINTVLKEINDSSKQLVADFETDFEAIFTNLKSQLGSANEEITTFDEEINGKISTLFDETMPTKFSDIGVNFGKMLTDNEKALTGSLGDIEKSIGGTIGNVQKKLETFLDWFDKNILDKTKADFWNKALGELSGVFEIAFRGVANTIATIVNSLIEQINTAMNVKWDNLVVNGQTVLAAGQAKLFEIQPIPMFERGGFPEDGLFYANHSEMVGRFSNGRTAVANNEQIVGGIREGVQEAMSDVVFNMLNPYLSDIAQSSRETANKDFSVNIGDRDIAMASNRGQSLVGMSIIS